MEEMIETRIQNNARDTRTYSSAHIVRNEKSNKYADAKKKHIIALILITQKNQAPKEQIIQT
jgi:hypothetical protein